MTDIDLINAAAKSLRNSYSPYSGFKVGAALLCASGKFFAAVILKTRPIPQVFAPKERRFLRRFQRASANL